MGCSATDRPLVVLVERERDIERRPQVELPAQRLRSPDLADEFLFVGHHRVGCGDIEFRLVDGDLADIGLLVQRERHGTVHEADAGHREPSPSMLRMLSSMVGYGRSFSMHDAASRSAAAEKSMRRYFIVYCFFLSHKCIVIPKLMAAILSRKRMFEALREPILLPSASFWVMSYTVCRPARTKSSHRRWGRCIRQLPG